jgi:thiamine biosynthesis lipoprotein
VIQATEIGRTFECFGSQCSVLLFGDGLGRSAEDAVEAARARLLSWHDRFTRFEPGSELSRLNADPREQVPVSAAMALFVDAVLQAARTTGGLVDATLLAEIERAGYRRDLRAALPLEIALEMAPRRAPAAAREHADWPAVTLDRAHRTVRRPVGMKFDSGGIAKGLCADLLARDLSRFPSFAIDCAGDLRLGGARDVPREVNVASPFDKSTLHTFELATGGVATSGIGRRSWLDQDGLPAHHLLDPATGRAAFTGVAQVTALAATALEAETRAKAALLSGPEGAARWLPDGGVVVHDDGSHAVLEPATGPDAVLEPGL